MCGSNSGRNGVNYMLVWLSDSAFGMLYLVQNCWYNTGFCLKVNAEQNNDVRLVVQQ